MKLLAIRHPQPLGFKGICYGHKDLDVTPDVLSESAETLRDQLSPDELQAVGLWLSSPLQRCQKLAQSLTDNYQVDERLLEMSFGDWEGLPWDQIDRATFDAWSADYVQNTTPNGESFGIVQKRVRNLLDELLKQELESSQQSHHLSYQRNVALITHGGVIRALLEELLGIPTESLWRFKINFGSTIAFELGGEAYQNRLLYITQGTG
ncbi:MAG: alpha-ribazole phosphatase family protein [Coriobacteriales bacterium]|jgi:alpha-ribazole phosphatase|nr:alpha-ribazole phosphatase family protein [Coriobacteriales bacterium]